MNTESLTLTFGQHDTREDGLCLMEAVAFLAGEEHSDRPKCACPVLSAFGRTLNDRMGLGKEGDVLRAKYLAPLAEKLAGTRSTPEVERRRVFFFADRAVRLFAPMALESARLKSEADRLRGLPEIVDEKTADAAARAAAATDAAARAARAARAAEADAAARAAADAADVAAAATDAATDAADVAAVAAAVAAAATDAAADAADVAAYAAAYAAYAADVAAYAADAAAYAGDWRLAASVLSEACEITEEAE